MAITSKAGVSACLRRPRLLLAGLCAALLTAAALTGCQRGSGSLADIRLPDGFSIEVFAERVPDARSLAWSPAGIVYVGNRRGDSVYALVVDKSLRQATTVHKIASGLNMPNGVAYRRGSLYVAEVGRILRFDDIDKRLEKPPDPVVVADDLPQETHHGWRYIRFGPDDKLYLPIGAPCNICDKEDFALIMRMDPDGSNREVIARGVRNSVGFDWHPDSQALWFTDNGRDMLGDDIPPCELNAVKFAGQHFGFPFCHGDDISDPEFGAGKSCAEFTPPEMPLGPHVAPLGMRFYRGKMFPDAYKGRVFIAEHGSWNRSEKIGYRVSMVGLEDGEAVSYAGFAEGWLNGEEVSGRPVDILEMPDGALLVSDDMSGRVYRIAYGEKP